VLLTDLILFYSSALLLVNLIVRKTNINDNLATLTLVLFNPTIVLIDHGHFQYNCASLGFMQLAVYFIFKFDNDNKSSKQNMIYLALGSFSFCLALNYKQMELYHALPFFFYLLSICYFKCNSFLNGLEEVN
jgi:alpha-1,3-glucosyltransferase